MSHLRPPRLCIVFVLVWVAAVLVPGAVFGTRARSESEAIAYKNWSVSSLTVVGVDKKTASDIKKGLALGLSTGFLGTKSPRFFPQTLEEDVKRVKLYLARRGYPYTRVSARFDPNPGKESVGVTIVVDKGPPVRIASTQLAGIPTNLSDQAQEAVTLKSDSVLVDSEVDETGEALARLLGENGYARAAVTPRVSRLDTTRVDVVFEAEPGTLYYFGGITVSGVEDDLVPLVRRTVVIRRGKRFDPKALADSEENLRALGLFRQVRLDPQDAAPDTLDVAADLAMRESRTIETGVRYWSDEKLDLGFRWTHRNLFKEGRGGAVVMSYSWYLRKAEFTAWWPAVLMPRSRLSATVGTKYEDEDSYQQWTNGLDLALSYARSARTRARWDVEISNVKVKSQTNPPGEIIGQEGPLAALGLTWETDRANDPIVPTRGFFTGFSVEWAPANKYTDYYYLLFEPTFSAYLGVPRTRQGVLATRLCIGVGDPLGNSADLLPGKRFYSGGSNSMRGFQRRKLGPLDKNGAPLGGEAKLEASLELRYPVFWKFHGTTFVDTGQVWPTIDSVVLDSVDFAVGQGVWFSTIVGPIRGDLAYQLTNYQKNNCWDEWNDRWVFHFSIGPAF